MGYREQHHLSLFGDIPFKWRRLEASDSTRNCSFRASHAGAVDNDDKFPDAAGTERSGNYLIYDLANQVLFRSEAGSNRRLDATLALDGSRENSPITAGVRYNGAIPSRPRDTIAFGFAHTKIGDPFRPDARKLCGLLEVLPHVPACVSVLLGCKRQLACA